MASWTASLASYTLAVMRRAMRTQMSRFRSTVAATRSARLFCFSATGFPDTGVLSNGEQLLGLHELLERQSETIKNYNCLVLPIGTNQ